MDNDFTPEWCQYCNQSSIFAYYERGGQAFTGQQHIRATDNQYLVEWVCEQCGRSYGWAVVDAKDEIENVEE